MKPVPSLFPAVSALASGSAAAVDVHEATLVIQGHRFLPAEMTIPAGKKVRLTVVNRDATPRNSRATTSPREGRGGQRPHRGLRRAAAPGPLRLLRRFPRRHGQGHPGRRISTRRGARHVRHRHPRLPRSAGSRADHRHRLRRNAWPAPGAAAGWRGHRAGRARRGRGRAGADRIANLAEGMGQELLNAAVLSAAVLMLAWHAI